MNISTKIYDLQSNMNLAFDSIEIIEEISIRAKFRIYLSIVFDNAHDNRFLDLEKDNQNNLILSIDAVTTLANATDIMFALMTFLDFISYHDFRNIILNWC